MDFVEFTDNDDGIRRVITDVVFSHEDDVYYARYSGQDFVQFRSLSLD